MAVGVSSDQLIEYAVIALVANFPGDTLPAAVREVADMATRAATAMATGDEGWWHVVGAPHFNSRMDKIRKLLEEGDGGQWDPPGRP